MTLPLDHQVKLPHSHMTLISNHSHYSSPKLSGIQVLLSAHLTGNCPPDTSKSIDTAPGKDLEVLIKRRSLACQDLWGFPTMCSVPQNLIVDREAIAAPGWKQTMLFSPNVEELQPFREQNSLVQGRVSGSAGRLFIIQIKSTFPTWASVGWYADLAHHQWCTELLGDESPDRRFASLMQNQAILWTLKNLGASKMNTLAKLSATMSATFSLTTKQ